MKSFYITKVVSLLFVLCVFDEMILLRITNQTVSQLLIQNDEFSKLLYKVQQFNKGLTVRSSIYSVCVEHRQIRSQLWKYFQWVTLVLILFSSFSAFPKGCSTKTFRKSYILSSHKANEDSNWIFKHHCWPES